MKSPISPLLWQEISGPIVGAIFLGSVIGIFNLTSRLETTETIRGVLTLTWLMFVIIGYVQFRNYVTKQPTKSHAHVAHVFENEHKAWEVHAVVKTIKPVSLNDPAFVKLPIPSPAFWYLYEIEFSHITIIGNNSFEFHRGLFFTDVVIGELYGPISHEILYKGFAAQVGAAFLRYEYIQRFKVVREKEEEELPVFMIRAGHYHAKLENRVKDLPKLEAAMLNSGRMVTQVEVLNMEKEIIKREEEARKDGIHIGREQGKALVREYKAGVDEGFNLPRLRAHPKLYALLGLSVGLLVLGWFMGWLPI